MMRADFCKYYGGASIYSSKPGSLISFTFTEPYRHVGIANTNAWLQMVASPYPMDVGEGCETLAELVVQMLACLSQHTALHPDRPRLLRIEEEKLQIWTALDDHQASIITAELVCRCLKGVIERKVPSNDDRGVWQKLFSRRWNQTHRHLALACEQLDMPCYRIDRHGQQFLQIGQGNRQRLVRETLTDQTSLFASRFTGKDSIHEILASRGVPLPRQRVVRTLEQALMAAVSIGWPVVLKPVSSGKGRGVWVNLQSPTELERAWSANGGDKAPPQLVQQLLQGQDHRFLVSYGELMAVAIRKPSCLVGDGIHTVEQLLEELNADPRRGWSYEKIMNRVPIDQRLNKLLAEQGLELGSIPALNQQISLSRTANISQGGIAVDVTDRTHPHNRLLAIDIARLLNADVVGLDIISSDVEKSWLEGDLWLLEVNLSPGLRPHLIGNPRTNLCSRLITQWCHTHADGRIPTTIVVGDGDAQMPADMLRSLLSRMGKRIGSVDRDKAAIYQEDAHPFPMEKKGLIRQFLLDQRVEGLVCSVTLPTLIAELDVTEVSYCVFPSHINSTVTASDQKTIQHLAMRIISLCRDLVICRADDPLLHMLPTNPGLREKLALIVHERMGSDPEDLLPDWAGCRAVCTPPPHPSVKLLHGKDMELSVDLASAQFPSPGPASEAVLSSLAIALLLAYRMQVAPADLTAHIQTIAMTYTVGMRKG
jgi:D-alanine-D-alanine ligase-like ATP-grasp enzyme